MEAPTPEQDAETATLETEYNRLEVRERAAIISETDNGDTPTPSDTGADAELRSIQERADLGNYFASIVDETPLLGAELELRQHFGGDAASFPLAMLEERAAVTLTDAAPTNAAAVIPQIFPTSAAMFAGVAMERVGAGERSYPVLSTGATVHSPAEGGDAAETNGAFTITTLEPKRLQAGFSYQVEDAARFSYMGAALQQNLTAALQSKLDERILNRATDGLLAFGTAPDNPGTASTAAAYISAMFAGVDGLYADAVSQVKILVGAGATGVYQHMGALKVNTGAAAEMSVAEKLAMLGMLRVSAHVPDYASNRQEALIIKGAPRRNCVAALWPNISLIVDRVTRSSQGEVKLTALMLYDFAILRTAGYTRHRFRTS